MKEDIIQWINEFVSVHNEEYGQTPCPYAKDALTRYEETEDLGQSLADTINNWSDDVHVVVIHTATENYTVNELRGIISKFNQVAMPNDFVALEDHPEDSEIINGVKMNFGKCILVLVQRLSKLNEGSTILRDKGYYNMWSQENLDDVVDWRFDW
jgi:hypothetical protein